LIKITSRSHQCCGVVLCLIFLLDAVNSNAQLKICCWSYELKPMDIRLTDLKLGFAI